MLNEDINHCIDLFKHGRYRYISDKNLDVDNENVMEITKNGRRLLDCSCKNHTRFCNEVTICRHKLFFILFPLINKFNNKFEELELVYNTNRSLLKDEQAIRLNDMITDDLSCIKRLKV